MSTEENETTTPQGSSETQSSPDQADSHASPGNADSHARNEPATAAPAEAAPTHVADDDWEEQPGDDVGNRIPGAPRGPGNQAPQARPRVVEAAADPARAQDGAAVEGGAPARKRRRRRRKKGPGLGATAEGGAPGDQAATGEGDDSEATDDAPQEGEGEGHAAPTEGGDPKKKRERRRGKGPPPGARERPAFGIGEEVFGKVARVTEDAIWVDIAGKAVGLFDLRELSALPAAEAEVVATPVDAAMADAMSNESAAPAVALAEPPAIAVEPEAIAPAPIEAASAPEPVVEAAAEIVPAAAPPDAPSPAVALAPGELPVEGDQFIATVASIGVRGGMLMLSRAPSRIDAAKKLLEAAAASGDTVEGFVTGAVKGGLEVDIGGVRAFAPASHVDLRHGANLGPLVGRRLDFHVAQYAKKGRDVVVSRKRMLEADGRRARKEALRAIEPGSVHMGVVRSVVAWGVFVALPDAGGVEGLIHMTEASHDRGARIMDLFKQGEEIEVKVIRVDDKGKLWLSRKAVVADPWDAVKQKYAVGSRHKGKVARIQPFGAFIELEPAVDGLIHTADLSLKQIEKPEDVVKIGDEIDVVVDSCDAGSHKIGLHPAPPAGEEEEPRQKVQPHKALKVAVVQTTENGLIVRILGATG